MPGAERHRLRQAANPADVTIAHNTRPSDTPATLPLPLIFSRVRLCIAYSDAKYTSKKPFLTSFSLIFLPPSYTLASYHLPAPQPSTLRPPRAAESTLHLTISPLHVLWPLVAIGTPGTSSAKSRNQLSLFNTPSRTTHNFHGRANKTFHLRLHRTLLRRITIKGTAISHFLPTKP